MSAVSGQKSRRVDRTLVIIEALVGLGVVAAIIGRTYGAASTVMFIIAGIAAAFTGAVLVRMVTALRDDTLDIPGPVIDHTRAELEHEKQILLQGIKEFEADAGQGKVDADDYEHLRKTAEARAVEIIRELQDSDRTYLEQAEALISKRVGKPPQTAPEADESRATGRTSKPAKQPVAPKKPDAPKKTSAAARTKPSAKESSPFSNEPVTFSAEAHTCDHCRTDNPEDARFCIGCGRPRSTEESAA